MSVSELTHRFQTALADYCRSGELRPIQGARTDRLPVYRRLVSNVMRTNLENAYPITDEALGVERFDGLVTDFCAQHSAQSPYLWRYPYEFYQFVESGGYAEEWEVPYLNELMLFEWLEIEVYMMADLPALPHSECGELASDPVVLNPEHRLNRFEYPVFRTAPTKLLAARGNYFLFTYRHPKTTEVEFVELSPPFALAIEFLRVGPIVAGELWEQVSAHFPSLDPEAVQQQGDVFLRSMLDKAVLLGYSK